MLLDQAAESFQKYAYTESIPNINSFRYRIVSGSNIHDRTIDILNSDDLLIVSKDSLGRNLGSLDKWLKGTDEIYLVVDEAHHSTAKTYRKIIDYVQKRVKHTKLIGLTATPFRTAQEEQGLLAKIYSDGVRDGKAVSGDVGITYQIGLKELINRQILSKPIFESYYTDEAFGETLGIDDWDNITHLDILPESITQQMVDSKERNRLIIQTYQKNQMQQKNLKKHKKLMLYYQMNQKENNMINLVMLLFKITDMAEHKVALILEILTFQISLVTYLDQALVLVLDLLLEALELEKVTIH